MLLSKFPLKQTLGALLVSGAVVLGFPQVSLADCSGLTLWSGLDNRNDELPFCWDFEMRSGARERYRFHIPAEKIPEGVSKIRISYEERYNGRFDTNNIDIRIGEESLPRETLDILSDEEANFVEIGIDLELLEELGKTRLKSALEQGHSLQVVFHNVRNPRFGGMFYFRGSFLPANNEVPVFLDIGTWILSINRR
jgi:hypothetical protein